MILEKSKQCPKNFHLNEDGFCEDIDECVQEGVICRKDQICINRIGFFDCLEPNATFVCETGLVKNGQACVDVDECTEHGGQRCDKNQRCINLIGSYECVNVPKNESRNEYSTDLQNRDSTIGSTAEECEDYQERNSKGECIDIDVCAQKSAADLCGKNANCTSIFGKPRCDCHEGYVKNATTGFCEDHNECETFENRCMNISSTCRNLEGSYECVCLPGFERPENGTGCVNTDECKEPDVHKCHHGCLDTPGSFECQCWDGYDLQEDGKTCLERDQCHSKSFCDGICERTGEGKYSCKKCPTGLFRLDTQTEKCFPIDECKEREICSQHETCIDLKNGKKASCVDLTCPEDYEVSKEDSLCLKRDSFKDSRPLAISKRVIRLPLSGMNSSETKTIYRFNQIDNLGEDKVEFKMEIINPTYGELAVDSSHFQMIDQKLSRNLLLVKPIQKEQQFDVNVNVIYKGKILHQSQLYVFIV